MADIAPGHNLPPFDPATLVADNLILADQLRAFYGHLFAEQAMLVANALKWLEAHQGGIKDDDDQAIATEIVAQLKTVLDAYHGKPGSAHTTAKEGYLEGGRIVDKVLNAELAGPVRACIQDMVLTMQSYAQRKLREAQALAAAAAKKAADEAAARAPTSDPMAALQAEQDAMDAAAVASQPVGQQSQIRGDLGGMSSLRGKWAIKITDESKIPRQFMMPNVILLKAAMDSSKDKSGRPTAVIVGVEWVLETTLAIRK
jgi:hypothetical protein